MAWGKTGDVYTTPTLRIEAPGSPWLADAAVTAWSLERELVGSILPGNIRLRSGLTIGSAGVTVAPASGLMAPWLLDASRRVEAGGSVQLYVDDPDGGTDLSLGTWVVDPTSGALSSAEIQVDLLEDSYRGRDRNPVLPMQAIGAQAVQGAAPTDPIWTIDRLAASLGFHHVPPAVPSAVFSQPLTGSLGSDLPGGVGMIGAVGGWGTETGATGPAEWTLGTLGYDEGLPVNALSAGQSGYLTFNATGLVHFYDAFQGWHVVVDMDAGTLAVGNVADGAQPATVSFVPGESADWPTRVTVEIKRVYVASGAQPAEWSSTSARIKSGPNAAWSSWATDSTTYVPPVDSSWIVFVGGVDLATGLPDPLTPGLLGAVQVTTEDDPDLWLPRNSFLAPFGGELDAPQVAAESDTWGGIQAVADAWLAAVIVDRDGNLRLYDQERLAGVGETATATDIGLEWTDLPWTLDPGDTADRLELSYVSPATVLAPTAGDADFGDWGPIAWQADEVISIRPGETVVVKAHAEDRHANAIFAELYGAWQTPDGADTAYLSYSSTVSVFDNAAGIGTHLSVDVLRKRTVFRAQGILHFELTNVSGQTVYLVDGNGEPCLIMRSDRVTTFESSLIVARGADSDSAQNPMTIDLGSQVQRPEDAERIADYLWSRISAPAWKASSVRCRLDWDHEIGRVLQLTHSRSGLSAKALITKVAYEGSAGEIAQTIDLVLLPPTWADFDETWVGATWADFDAEWSPSTWVDFDRDPLRRS